MTKSHSSKTIANWFDETIEPGEARNVHLAVGESYSSVNVEVQIHIRRALRDGPVVFVRQHYMVTKSMDVELFVN